MRKAVSILLAACVLASAPGPLPAAAMLRAPVAAKTGIGAGVSPAGGAAGLERGLRKLPVVLLGLGTLGTILPNASAPAQAARLIEAPGQAPYALIRRPADPAARAAADAPAAGDAHSVGSGPVLLQVLPQNTLSPRRGERAGVRGDSSRSVAEAREPALESLRSGAQEIARADAAPESSLLRLFDARAAFAAAEEPLAPGDGSVRADYRRFLGELGFKPFAERIGRTLAEAELTGDQRKVLELSRSRLRVLDASRELAASAMAGLDRQGYSEEALGKTVELAATFLELRPLEPPSRLPYEVAGMSRRGIVRWLVEATEQKIAAQSAAVVSDFVDAAYARAEFDARRLGPEAEPLRREIGEIKDAVETVLVSMYADAEMGSGRFAGRALLASLVRHARKNGRADIEERLESALRRRGFRLSDYVGSEFELRDDRGVSRRFSLRTGDVLGTRSRSRRSSEIAAGAIPHWTRWWRAWREGLFGNPIGIWVKPLEKEAFQAPGQGLRNWLRRKIHSLRRRLANTRPFLRGYSHVGLADVREADGVEMVWVWENEVDAGEGGIRLVSFWDQFLVGDYHARFGYARWDALKTWAAFSGQARRRGYREIAHGSKDGAWLSAVSAEDYERLRAIPRSRAAELSAELHRRAVRMIETMMTGFGIGYGYGLADSLYRAVCTSTIVMGYKIGAQFEPQSRFDRFHPLARLLKWLGTKNTAGLDMNARIIWPGSFFSDEKVAEHFSADLPGRSAGRSPADLQTVPAQLPRSAASLLRVRELLSSGGEDPFRPKRSGLFELLRRQLIVRRFRQRLSESKRGGVGMARGYFRAVERLYSGKRDKAWGGSDHFTDPEARSRAQWSD